MHRERRIRLQGFFVYVADIQECVIAAGSRSHNGTGVSVGAASSRDNPVPTGADWCRLVPTDVGDRALPHSYRVFALFELE